MNLCSLFSNAVQESLFIFLLSFYITFHLTIDYKYIAIVINDSPVFV